MTNFWRALWCAGFACAFAQAATVTGIVRDPDGQPIPNARVVLYTRDNSLRIGGAAGQDGSYRLDNLAAGEYLLEASAPGLTGQTAIALETDGRANRTVDIVLRMAQVRTEIVVTASGLAQSADQVSRAVDVIESDEARRRVTPALTDAIRTVPGIRVQSLGGPGSFTRILSRGLRTEDTAVTIDGMRFRDAATTQGDASPFLEDLFLVGTDRVEVLRGTASSLYGSNAIGSVVNVVSAQGGGPLHGELLAEGGGLGLWRGAARAGGGAWDNRLAWSGAVQHLNVTRGIDGQDAFRNTSGQGWVQFRPTARTSLSGRLWSGDSFGLLNDSPYAAPSSQLPPAGPIRAIPVSLDVQREIEAGGQPPLGGATIIPDLNDPDSSRAARFTAAALRFSHQLTPRVSYRASWQHSGTRRDFRDGPAGVRFEPLVSNSTVIEGGVDTLQTRADVQPASWSLISAGYEFERETYFNSFQEQAPQYEATARQRSHSGFVHAQGRFLHDRLQVSASGRLQSFRIDPPRFTGGAPVYAGVALPNPPAAKTADAAAAYFVPSTGTKFRAHTGNGYRAPSIYERVGATFYEGFFSPLGDPRLRPDRSLAFDWGVDQYLAGQKVRLSATQFYTNLQEVIIFDFSGYINPATDPYGRFGGYRNTGGGLARGVEVSAQIAPHRGTSVMASYTYTNADVRQSTSLGGDFFKMPLVSDHQVTAVVLQRLTRRLEMAADVWIVSGHSQLYSQRPFLFDGASKVDLVLRYAVPVSDRTRLEFYGKVNNTFDSRYLENGFRTPGIWGVGGLNVIF